MGGMSSILVLLLQFASLLFVGRAVMSWFPIAPDSAFAPVHSFIFGVTEPVLAPVRRMMPRMGALDLSIFAVLIIISFVLTPIARSL